jgi:hypothetical protein
MGAVCSSCESLCGPPAKAGAAKKANNKQRAINFICILRIFFPLVATAPKTGLRLAAPLYELSLRVNPPLTDGVCHAVNGQHVSRDPVVHAMSLGIADHILEGGDHNGLQLFVHH